MTHPTIRKRSFFALSKAMLTLATIVAMFSALPAPTTYATSLVERPTMRSDPDADVLVKGETHNLLGSIKSPPSVESLVFQSPVPPVALNVDPAPNTHTAPLTTTVSATFGWDIDATSVTSVSFAVHGMQSGLVTETHGVVNGSTVIVTPTNPFHQGELVYAVVTTRTRDITGTELVSDTQWQFRAGVVSNRCVGTFVADTVASVNLKGVGYSSVDWGDYDNDGDLDILLTGVDDGDGRHALVYENTGTAFVTDTVASANLTGVAVSSVDWGDYDNDGDLDILLTGRDSGGGYNALVYENTGTAFVTDTVASVGLTGVGYGNVVWGDYDNDGDLDILLTGQDSGGGYNALVYENTGGAFVADTVASVNLMGVSESSVAWGDYDDDGDLDILLTGRDSGGGDNALMYENTGSGAGFVADTVASVNLTGVYASSVDWGDYDNDGDLDILLTGQDSDFGYNALVYENTGGAFVTDTVASANLTGVYYGSAAWGDYDNDGDLDILLTGRNSGSPNALVYENTGSTFVVDTVASANLTGVAYSSAAWGDYDDDGDLDILLTGQDSGGGYNALVYRNDDCPDLAIDKTVSPTTAIPGETITYTLSFTNNGPGTARGVVITDRIPVSVTNPTVAGSSGVTITAVGTISYVWSVSDLAFGQSGMITVTAAIRDLLAAGTFTNTAQIASTSRDVDETDNSSDSAVTVPNVYGVTIAPPTDAASGDPGSDVTYTLIVTNTGNTVDTFTLSKSGDTWTTVVPAPVGPLAAGVSTTVVVTVTVDSGAACGDSDGVTVTATSQGSGTESDSSTLTTSANAVYGVIVAPPAASASGDPGADVVYTLWVTNTGNCADTFALGKSGDTWTTVVPAPVGPLAAGVSTTVAVTVTVDSGAACGDSDGVTVTATSQGSGTESDSSTLTTSANTVYGVIVAPPAAAASGDPGADVVHTLWVTNTGNCADTFALGKSGETWTTVVPASVGPLAAGTSATVAVTVTVDGGAACGASDSVTVTATSQGSGAESDSSTLTTSANAVYGVIVAPPTASASGDPGADVPYTLWVTNTGNCADTFGLGKSGDAWTTVVPASVGPLAAGMSTTVAVTVTVDGGAACGDSDSVTVTATSQGSGTESDSSTLTTSANAVYGVIVAPPAASASGDPGADVVHTLWVTNTGNCVDTFALGKSGDTWTTVVPASVGPLAAGMSTTVAVTVTVDGGAACSASDSVTVTATSQGSGAESDSSTLTTSANAVYGVIVAPPTASASGDPGADVPYTLWVTNTGNCVDTFALGKSGETWTTVVPASVGPLAAGMSATVAVTVTVDGGAACGDSDGVTVTATSQGSGTESDSSTLTTSANAVYGVIVAPPAASASGDPGADVVYTLWVTNTGNCVDTFALGKSGETWTTAVPASVGPLAAGASATVAVTVTVPGNATVGSSDTVTISATSQGDGTVTGSSTLTTSHLPKADLSISKTSNRLGNNVTFVIVVRNAGPSDASGAIISDTVPAGVSTFDWACVSGGGATCTASGSGDIADTVNLPSGSVLTYTVNAAIAVQGLIVNTAEVIAPAGVIDPDTSNNRASADAMMYIYLPIVFRNYVN